jgi:hypothetical protein
MEVEECEEAVEETPVVVDNVCTSKYVPYKSTYNYGTLCGTSAYRSSYLGSHSYGHGYGHTYTGHSAYVPYVSTYVPKVCTTTTTNVCPTTTVCLFFKVEAEVEEEVVEAEVKCEEVAEIVMDEKVAETLRKSR